MGETARLRNRKAGTFGLNDFIAQGDNEATIPRLLKIMVPTIDMRDFQRRYKFGSDTRVVNIGEQLLIRFVVPAGEHWRPRGLLYENDDTINHTVTIHSTVDNTPPALEWQAVRITIAAKSIKLVYGAHQLDPLGIQHYISFFPLILEPSDVFFLRDRTDQATTGTQKWTFIYEIVPEPTANLERGVAGLSSVSF